MTSSTPELIKADTVLYIKLGRRGEWENECLRNGTLRLGYREINHDLCRAAAWDEVLRACEKDRGERTGAATSDRNQIRHFYEADENVLWVTFSQGRLWWCFSRRDISPRSDGSRTRPTVGSWRDADIKGKPLMMSELPGILLAIQGYRGTICAVREHDALVRRINAVERDEIAAASRALSELENRIGAVIAGMAWRDFELLVEMVFSRAGWQRVSSIGGTTKTLDLEYLSPVTSERYGVQVKSQADRETFMKYINDRFTAFHGFAGFYFVVHTPDADLASPASPANPKVHLLLREDVSRLVVQYGLAKWVIDKGR